MRLNLTELEMRHIAQDLIKDPELVDLRYSVAERVKVFKQNVLISINQEDASYSRFNPSQDSRSFSQVTEDIQNLSGEVSRANWGIVRNSEMADLVYAIFSMKRSTHFMKHSKVATRW